MASAAAAVSLTPAAVRQLIDTNQPPNGLALLHLTPEADSEAWRCAAYLLKYRENGFMTVLPFTDAVESYLASTADSEDPVVYRTLLVEVENSRRRALGETAVFFCDFPWTLLPLFRRPARLRLTSSPFDAISIDGQAARPVGASAQLVADAWVLEATDELAGYVTAEEMGPEGPELVPDGEVPGLAEDAQGRLIRDLQARLAHLESGFQAQPGPPLRPPREPGRCSPTRPSPAL